MPSLDRCRRAATVLLVATFLVLVPQLATATFTARQEVSQPVGTATLVQPTGVTGTWQCWVGGNGGIGNGNGNGYNHGYDHDNGWEAVQVSVTGFSDAGPAGATYEYSLGRAGIAWVSQYSSTQQNGWLVNGSFDDGLDTTWTLTIRSTYGSWTGPQYTRSISCPRNKDASGSF
jgi:hypothetical protein